MPVQKKRHTHARQNRRRKQYQLQPISLQSCTSCGKQKLAHRACPNCGSYAGREVKGATKKVKAKKKT